MVDDGIGYDYKPLIDEQTKLMVISNILCRVRMICVS